MASGQPVMPGTGWRTTMSDMMVQPSPAAMCCMTAARLTDVGARRGVARPLSASSSSARS